MSQQRARKTFDVAALREQVNSYLAVPAFPGSTEAEAQVARGAVAGMLESVLHSTGNYRGFRYLPTETEEDGVLRSDYDDTRRCYA